MARILIIEDNAELAAGIKHNLVYLKAMRLSLQVMATPVSRRFGRLDLT
jgi:hypothetical protein